ncbi:MAG: hypothetical protein M3437_14300 [Chloroflexota bacterium]|nr:hypothetical protein [Chloroflexota bacterium]MDQ5864571.1 hypothetical protein [Chloroflexota bacterium]
MDELEPLLTKLGYSPMWLEYGLIDEELLRQQSNQFDASHDKHTEHYRYKAFQSFLDRRAILDDVSLDMYIHLAQLDEDPTMRQSALILLVRYPHLTETQLARLGKHPAFASLVVQRSIRRIRALRKLPPTDTSH